MICEKKKYFTIREKYGLNVYVFLPGRESAGTF